MGLGQCRSTFRGISIRKRRIFSAAGFARDAIGPLIFSKTFCILKQGVYPAAQGVVSRLPILLGRLQILWKRNRPPPLAEGIVYSVLKNPDDALDAVQTAVCHALERQGSLRDTGAVRSWFYRILMNTCNDALRQRGRTVRQKQAEAGRSGNPPLGRPAALSTIVCLSHLDARLDMLPQLEPSQEDREPADDTLSRRVDALPAEVGTVIKLRFYEEMTLKEISQITGQNLKSSALVILNAGWALRNAISSL